MHTRLSKGHVCHQYLFVQFLKSGCHHAAPDSTQLEQLVGVLSAAHCAHPNAHICAFQSVQQYSPSHQRVTLLVSVADTPATRPDAVSGSEYTPSIHTHELVIIPPVPRHRTACPPAAVAIFVTVKRRDFTAATSLPAYGPWRRKGAVPHPDALKDGFQPGPLGKLKSSQKSPVSQLAWWLMTSAKDGC